MGFCFTVASLTWEDEERGDKSKVDKGLKRRQSRGDKRSREKRKKHKRSRGGENENREGHKKGMKNKDTRGRGEETK